MWMGLFENIFNAVIWNMCWMADQISNLPHLSAGLSSWHFADPSYLGSAAALCRLPTDVGNKWPWKTNDPSLHPEFPCIDFGFRLTIFHSALYIFCPVSPVLARAVAGVQQVPLETAFVIPASRCWRTDSREIHVWTHDFALRVKLMRYWILNTCAKQSTFIVHSICK